MGKKSPIKRYPQRHEMGALYHDLYPRHYHNHCFYCGRIVNQPPRYNPSRKVRLKPHYRSIDHVEPRSNGATRERNTVVACMGCNGKKSSLSLGEWRIVFFGVHGGEFYGEKIERQLRDGVMPCELQSVLHAPLPPLWMED